MYCNVIVKEIKRIDFKVYLLNLKLFNCNSYNINNPFFQKSTKIKNGFNLT
jgi:hypothetical protein